MDLELKNKIVLISGATGSIGTAITRGFLDEGAVVVALYRNSERYSELLENLGEYKHDKLHPYLVDFRDSSQISKAVGSIIKNLGTIDVLVNNNGSSRELPFLMMSEEDWNRDIDINLNIPARITRAVLKYMFIQKAGSVVNISTLLAHRYGRGAAAYASAKAGLDRFTQVLAQEVGPKGVRVNSICPGLINTPMSEEMISRRREYLTELTALRRFGSPDEVVSSVLFLASEKTSSFITGHSLIVDGGIGI